MTSRQLLPFPLTFILLLQVPIDVWGHCREEKYSTGLSVLSRLFSGHISEQRMDTRRVRVSELVRRYLAVERAAEPKNCPNYGFIAAVTLALRKLGLTSPHRSASPRSLPKFLPSPPVAIPPPPAGSTAQSLAQSLAQVVLDTKIGRYDAGDLMPSDMRNAYWSAILQFAQNQGQLDSILAHLDSVQQTAYVGTSP